MSITFYPASKDGAVIRPLLRCACDHAGTCAACLASMNLSDANASDLLSYLGLDGPGRDDIGATELRALCERRLSMVDVEPEREPTQTGRVFTGGRSAVYLRGRCQALLVIAKLAGPHRVAWS